MKVEVEKLNRILEKVLSYKPEKPKKKKKIAKTKSKKK
jgi:hypothetical protein